jgi:hypothetical protein
MNFREQVLSEWERDCKVDPLTIKAESLNTAILNAKYLRFLSHARDEHIKAQQEEDRIEKVLSDYYRAKLNQKETLAKLQRPIQLEAVTWATLPLHLKSDRELQRYHAATVAWKDTIEILKSILDELTRRGFAIKNHNTAVALEAGVKA